MMKYEEILENLIYKFKSESEMTKAILKVSNNFTSSRESIKDYLSDEAFVSAYSAFYFPTNYLKFAQIVSKVPRLKDILRSCEIVEIGSGPGSFTFSMTNFTSEKVYGLETSSLMRKQAEVFKKVFFKGSNVDFVSGTRSIPQKEGKRRIVIFTNSFNEMGSVAAYEYIRTLGADYVLFIEPGTSEVFKSLLPVRDKLISRKFNILYPCSLNTSCPLAEKEDWCHQYLKLELDLEVQRISQLVKINKKWQAACIHLYSQFDLNSEDQSTVLRTFTKTKFSKDWQICESNEIKEFSNMKKDYSSVDFRYLENILAGDVIHYETIGMLKSGQIRGKVNL